MVPADGKKGKRTGDVSEAEFQITVMISEQGEKSIGVGDVIVGGFLPFDGLLQDLERMTGTLDGGLLGGTFSVTFHRES